MRKLLVTGASGQLGGALARLGGDLAVVGRAELDFDKPLTLDRCLANVQPWAVVNAAAYTAVDAAETDQGAAARANHLGPARLAMLCKAAGIPLIHVSTDYVFDGGKGAPYVETDAARPCGVYGASKRAGELAVLEAGGEAVILRTAWLYSAKGRNFARTMLGAALKSGQLRVVADQIGCPTAAADLARVILAVAGKLREGWRAEYGGVFHACAEGWTSWHGFAEAIFAAAAPLGLRTPAVAAIGSGDWPTPVTRPKDSRLDCGKLEAVFGCRLPRWQAALPGVVAEILAELLPERGAGHG